MDHSGLSDKEVAALKLLAENGNLLVAEAQRARERRMRRGQANATVRKRDWTIEEARLSGKRHAVEDLTKAVSILSNKIARLEKELEVAEADLVTAQRNLDEYEKSLS